MEFTINLSLKKLAFMSHLLEFDEYDVGTIYEDPYELVFSVALNYEDKYIVDDFKLFCMDKILLTMVKEIDVCEVYKDERNQLKQIAQDWVWNNAEIIDLKFEDMVKAIKEEYEFKQHKENYETR